MTRALARPRFELIPVKGAREQAAYLPEGAKVAIGCSPAKGIENTLLLGEELLERGFQIVPHISARLVADRAHFLTKHINALARFFRAGGYNPDELVKALAPYVGDQAHNIAGFHLYTFNQVESTEEWRQGRFAPGSREWGVGSREKYDSLLPSSLGPRIGQEMIR